MYKALLIVGAVLVGCFLLMPLELVIAVPKWLQRHH
jgi:hypothetical protein